MELVIGALLVFLVACQRFNALPPRAPELPTGLPVIIGTVLSWFRVRSESPPDILSPPRANTTVYKFWFYRIAYGCVMVLIYILLCKVEGVRDGVRGAIGHLGQLDADTLIRAGNFGVAILVASVLPVIPPFKEAERTLRRTFYDHALIPARLLRERKRLETARYHIEPAVLRDVQEKLSDDGFDRGDVVYAGGATTRELWTKTAVLMQHISAWNALNQYAAAFAALRDADGETRSVDRLRGSYDTLKSNVRSCFRILRDCPGTPEVRELEQAIRRDVLALLERIYEVLGRISLHAHLSERDRVDSFTDIGFSVRMPVMGPAPDLNDILTLAVVVFTAFLPLTADPDITVRSTSVWAAASVAAAIIPILIANKYFAWAMAPSRRSLPLRFPIVAGLAAVLAGTVISVVHGAFVDSGGAFFDLRAGWNRFAETRYPWKGLQFATGCSVACLMRYRRYPKLSELIGVWRYRSVGSVRDALVVAAAMLGTLKFIVIPELTRIHSRVQPGGLSYGVSLLIGALIGFFVPTWYRAHLVRTNVQDHAVAMLPEEPARAA